MAPSAYVPLAWPVRRRLQLPLFDPPQVGSFSDVLETRRSVDAIAAAPLSEILRCLSLAMRARQARIDDPYRRTRRPSASAGALHPIHAVLVNSGGTPRAARYDPLSHTLDCLSVRRPDQLRAFRENAQLVLPKARGLWLVFGAERAKTAAVYEQPESLVWRDAGALMQTCHLCATALDLAFCPLGILGHELTPALFGDTPGLMPAGIACVGRHLGV